MNHHWTSILNYLAPVSKFKWESISPLKLIKRIFLFPKMTPMSIPIFSTQVTISNSSKDNLRIKWIKFYKLSLVFKNAFLLCTLVMSDKWFKQTLSHFYWFIFFYSLKYFFSKCAYFQNKFSKTLNLFEIQWIVYLFFKSSGKI